MTSRDRLSATASPRLGASVIPAELVPERRGAVSVLSSYERDGDWIVPRHFRAVAFFGSVELDLTQARVGPGVSEIELVAAMGSVTILVPPELRLECEGEPLVGSFEVKREAAATSAPDAPLLRITDRAVLGSIEIRVVDPNAPGWMEKLRARLTGE
jgi:hypothetical protein